MLSGSATPPFNFSFIAIIITIGRKDNIAMDEFELIGKTKDDEELSIEDKDVEKKEENDDQEEEKEKVEESFETIQTGEPILLQRDDLEQTFTVISQHF